MDRQQCMKLSSEQCMKLNCVYDYDVPGALSFPGALSGGSWEFGLDRDVDVADLKDLMVWPGLIFNNALMSLTLCA